MLKKLLFFLLTIVVISLQSGCVNNIEDNEITDVSSTTEREELTNPGEYLTDLIDTISIGDREFTLDITYDGIKNLFGTDCKCSYPAEGTVKEHFQEGNYVFTADILYNDIYWGYMIFSSENEDGTNAGLFSLIQIFPFDENISSFDIAWYEDSEEKSDTFSLNTGEITVSIGDFVSGASTITQIKEYFGDGVFAENYSNNGSTGNYSYEDYSITFLFDKQDTFIGYRIFTNLDYLRR